MTVVAPGINAKMNELQAAYGLLQLEYVNEYIARRKTIAQTYCEKLNEIPGIRFLKEMNGVDHSYSYFPVLIDAVKYGCSRNEIYEKLKKNSIFGRRYFYPLISQFPSYRGLTSARKENLPVATNVAEQVVCLPIYPALENENIDRIVEIMKQGML